MPEWSLGAVWPAATAGRRRRERGIRIVMLTFVYKLVCCASMLFLSAGEDLTLLTTARDSAPPPPARHALSARTSRSTARLDRPRTARARRAADRDRSGRRARRQPDARARSHHPAGAGRTGVPSRLQHPHAGRVAPLTRRTSTSSTRSWARWKARPRATCVDARPLTRGECWPRGWPAPTRRSSHRPRRPPADFERLFESHNAFHAVLVDGCATAATAGADRTGPAAHPSLRVHVCRHGRARTTGKRSRAPRHRARRSSGTVTEAEHAVRANWLNSARRLSSAVTTLPSFGDVSATGIRRPLTKPEKSGAAEITGGSPTRR